MRHQLRRISFLSVLVVCLPTILAVSVPAPAVAQGPEVWQAAGSWMALLDSGDFAGSWDQAAGAFKAAVTARQWASLAAGYREASGSPMARQLIDSVVVTDPDGVPPGQYVRLRFECECTRAGTVLETVLMVDEGTRGWRVASYSAVGG